MPNTSIIVEILAQPMKIIYDKETDTLSIVLREGKVAESDEVAEGLIFDYDKAGKLLSLELLDASETSPPTERSGIRAGRRLNDYAAQVGRPGRRTRAISALN